MSDPNNGVGFDVFLFSKENLRAGLLVSLLSVWVLVGVFYYLNRYTRRRYFSIWTVAWLFYALWLTLNLGFMSAEGRPAPAVGMLKQWCISVSATFLLWGSLSFLGQRVRQILLSLFLCFLFVWSFVGVEFVGHGVWIELPIFGLIGLASVFTATGFYRYRRKRDYIAAGLLAFGFSLWGIYLMLYAFLQTSEDLNSAGFFVSAVLQLFIAVSMIILVLEQVRFAHQRQALREIRQQKIEKHALQTRVISTEERYRTLFDQATEPIIIAAANDLRILELNEAAGRLLGIQRAEAGQQSLTSFCHLRAALKSTPKTHEEWFAWICAQRPLQLERKDGTVLATEVEGSLIDYDGTAAYQFFVREVTDRLHLEQQLHRAEKLSSLGQMISGVAHELQNPVAGIKAFLDLVLSGPALDNQVRLDLQRAAQECGRVSRLARNFLSLAREHSEHRQTVDLNEVIRNLIELRKFDFSVARIEAIAELAPDLPMIYANLDQVQQVLVNLMNNALQALGTNSKGGKVKVVTRALGDKVQIRVEDNGPGVPKQLEQKIFAPFFTTKPAGVGTGLGLSISHSIVCEHAGRLYYELSSLGGAAFIVELPVQPPTASANGAMEPELAATGSAGAVRN